MKTTKYVIKITGTDNYHAGYLGRDQWFTRDPLGNQSGSGFRAIMFDTIAEAATWAAMNGWTCSTCTVEPITFIDDEETQTLWPA
jgi:hypothetical protein